MVLTQECFQLLTRLALELARVIHGELEKQLYLGASRV